MRKTIIIVVLFFVFLKGNAQTGIGTATPNASAKLEVYAIDKGFLPPRMTAAQRAAIASPAAGLLVYQTDGTTGFYYFNGSAWSPVASSTQYGDVKSGFQASDHNGWILLNGRLKSTLTSSQQTQATSLGIGTNLPDASSAYLSQNGSSIGSVSGSNTVVLTQANLPNVSFTGSTGTSGNHAHNVDPPLTYTNTNGNHQHYTSFNNDDYNGGGGGNQSLEDDGGTWSNRYTSWAGDHNHYVDIPNFTSASNGDHTHSVTVSSGGSGTAVTVAPKTLTVNMFIYLGL